MTTNNSINAPIPFTVSKGGTGNSSLTAYSALCGGTTTTGVVQSVASVGTSGQILTSNGASALPTWKTGTTLLGQIVQVKSSTLTTTANTTSTSFNDTGMTVNITPSVNTHTIVIMYSLNIGGSGGYETYINLVRTVSASPTNILIGTGSIGSRIACSNANNAAVSGQTMWTMSNCYLDSPATTSAVTYSLQWRLDIGGGTTYLNQTATDTNSGSFPRAASSITVMEVVA